MTTKKRLAATCARCGVRHIRHGVTGTGCENLMNWRIRGASYSGGEVETIIIGYGRRRLSLHVVDTKEL